MQALTLLSGSQGGYVLHARSVIFAPLIAGFVSVTACGVLPGGVRPQVREERQRQAVETVLATRKMPVYVARDREGSRLWNLTREFYKQREYRLAWIDGQSPKSKWTI
jgi:hypothetical protein